jgi:hypothetical protein
MIKKFILYCAIKIWYDAFVEDDETSKLIFISIDFIYLVYNFKLI